MGIESQIKTATPPVGDVKTAPPAPGQTTPTPMPSLSSVVVSAPLSPRKAAKRAIELEESRQQRVEVQSLRHDPDAIRRAFETGDYPYKSKVTEIPLHGAHAAAAGGTAQGAELGQGKRREDRRPVRGPRRRRQGRHDQALHGASQPARRARRGAGEAERARAHAMVLPALHQAPALRRRDRVLRPLLVQPRRRRARDGLLQAQRISRVHAPVSGARADAGPLRHPAVQVLVLGDPRGAAPPLRSRARPTR